MDRVEFFANARVRRTLLHVVSFDVTRYMHLGSLSAVSL